ncbi:MAG: CBS domain-containing protein [Gammaproteobacteria bacterium]|jgi:signal-transduction protein with cAMP-binding, CBS, and nucleotidyltransferase domain|nr:CBS domain-containing protein [Gammaproteobacteria bacterium]
MSDRVVIRVRDVMKTKFDMVDGMATISQALQKMKHVETKCLVVDKRHEDDEYGILLISDIARKVLAQDLSPDRVNVYEIMAKPVAFVDPQMDIRYCARFLDNFKLSRVPVIDSRKVIGIVSFTDLILKGLYNNRG